MGKVLSVEREPQGYSHFPHQDISLQISTKRLYESSTASIKNRAHTRIEWRTSSYLGPLEDVVLGWSCGDIGRCEVALVEDADLVRLKGTNNGM